MNNIILNDDYVLCNGCNNTSYCVDKNICMYCDLESSYEDMHYIGYFYEDNDDTISTITNNSDDVSLISEDEIPEYQSI
jgi:hypothetical protein